MSVWPQLRGICTWATKLSYLTFFSLCIIWTTCRNISGTAVLIEIFPNTFPPNITLYQLKPKMKVCFIGAILMPLWVPILKIYMSERVLVKYFK